METNNGVLDSSNNIHDNFYLDTSDVGFLKFFTRRIIPNIPQDALINKKLLAKHARNFYQSKGSEQSFRFLFQAIYGQPVEFYYPKTDLFRTSSAVWSGKHTIKITSDSPYFSSIVGRKLISVNLTGESCIVDSYVAGQYGSTPYYTVLVSRPQGFFDIDEIIQTEIISDNSVVYARTLGLVASYKINTAGSGYAIGDSIIVSGGDGVDFSAVVESVDIVGGITEIKILDSGVGFALSPPVFISAGVGIGASVQFFIGAISTINSFADDSDFLSSNKKLQDGEIYQEFSYVLRSAVNSGAYKSVVDALIHPAGTKRISQYAANPAEQIVGEITVEHTIDDLFTRLVGHVINITHTPDYEPLSEGADLIRSLKPESLTPVVSSFSGSLAYMYVLFARAYGTSDEIIDPYGTYPLTGYANTPIQDLIKRLVRTYVDMRTTEQFVSTPSGIQGTQPFVGLTYNHFPTQTPLANLSDLNRTINPESLIPVVNDSSNYFAKQFNSLVKTYGQSNDVISSYSNEILSTYATYQISNLRSRFVVTQVQTSVILPPAPTYNTTWNPADKGAGTVLSNNNLTAASSTDRARSTFGASTGKYYWEVTVSDNSNYALIGVCKLTDPIGMTMDVGAGSYALFNYGNPYALYHDSIYGSLSGFVQVAQGGVIGVMLDLNAGTLGFKTTSGTFASAFTGLSGTYYAGFSGGSPGTTSVATANFGASPFTFTVPAGYNPGFGA
jgi:hypothetical protein